MRNDLDQDIKDRIEITCVGSKRHIYRKIEIKFNRNPAITIECDLHNQNHDNNTMRLKTKSVTSFRKKNREERIKIRDKVVIVCSFKMSKRIAIELQ
jgi:hypothetical protein